MWQRRKHSFVLKQSQQNHFETLAAVEFIVCQMGEQTWGSKQLQPKSRELCKTPLRDHPPVGEKRQPTTESQIRSTVEQLRSKFWAREQEGLGKSTRITSPFLNFNTLNRDSVLSLFSGSKIITASCRNFTRYTAQQTKKVKRRYESQN